MDELRMTAFPVTDEAGSQGAVREWLRVASYPDRNPGNPYIELLYKALASHGVSHAGRLQPDPAWLDSSGRAVDVVHVHWPERIWRGRRHGRLDRLTALLTCRSVRGVWRLSRFLERAHQRGVMRVWTVHNVEHHEGASAVDRWGYRVLARKADLLLCFSRAAEAELRQAYQPHARVLVMSIGSYKGVYPMPLEKSAARVRFGLRPDLPVVSCLGLLRPYKGVEIACDAIERLKGSVQLLVAGQPNKSFDVHTLMARAAGSGGSIVAVPRNLTEGEFSDAMGASDAVLLPYRAVTGSSVLFAAWTMGAGVIASDLPFFREALDSAPLRGRTFRTGDAEDLARTITEYLAVPADERCTAIAAAIEDLSPERVVVPFVEAMRAWRERSAMAAAAGEQGT